MKFKIAEIKYQYDSKMAKLLSLAEEKLPEFKDSVYEIDILLMRLLESPEIKDISELDKVKPFFNSWANCLYNYRNNGEWINKYSITESLDKHLEYLDYEIEKLKNRCIELEKQTKDRIPGWNKFLNKPHSIVRDKKFNIIGILDHSYRPIAEQFQTEVIKLESNNEIEN